MTTTTAISTTTTTASGGGGGAITGMNHPIRIKNPQEIHHSFCTQKCGFFEFKFSKPQFSGCGRYCEYDS